MIFGSVKVSELTEQHLQRLVSDQVQERDTVEYKKRMYGHSDEEKREMLKDISSMANHQGGYLLIGIEEDNEGIPINVAGIEPGNHVERIRDSCHDNIDKRIVGLEIEDVSLSNGRVVVVIFIPESINTPHMITFKGLNQFWKRHGRQKDKMTIDEIGEAFDKRLSNLNRLDRFLVSRKAEILENIGDKTYMVISSSPAYLRDEVVFDIYDQDLKQIISNPPQLVGRSFVSCGQPYPTIRGLRADQSTPYYDDEPARVRDYLEVFRNGYIEYGNLISRHGEELYFASVADAAYIVNFVHFIQKVYEIYLPFMPVVVNFALYNAKGTRLGIHKFRLRGIRFVQWPEQHLELGKFYVENLAAEAKLLPKAICDRLWQAFHLEKSDVFDDDGTFNG